MKGRVQVFLFYDKPNRGSLNALCGAFERAGLGEIADLHLVREREELVARVLGVVDATTAAFAAPPPRGAAATPSTDQPPKLRPPPLGEARRGALSPTLVCISFATPQYWGIRDLLAALADRPAGTWLVAGGPHPTAMPEQTLAMGFDVVVTGAGEQAFVDLVREMADASPGPWAPAAVADAPAVPPGVPSRPDASPEPSPPRPMSSMRPMRPIRPIRPIPPPLPLPPSVAPSFGAVGPVEITRGCPFRCGYCQTPRIFPGPPQHRSIDDIASQLAEQRGHRLRDFRFITPNAFGYGAGPGKTNPAAVEALLSAAAEAVRGGRVFFGTFPSEVRPEAVLPEMLELVRRFAHNDNLTLGLQTGSERLLATIGRGHTVADVFRAVDLSSRAGFAMNVDVIFGMPDETEEDADETLRVMRELIGIGARIHAHSYVPLPGTPWWPRPPAPTPPRLDAALNHLIPTGRLFGHWQAQRKLAARILQDLAQS